MCNGEGTVLEECIRCCGTGMDPGSEGPSLGSTTITGDLLIGDGDLTPCRDEYITRGEVEDMLQDPWEFIKGLLAGVAVASLGCFVAIVFILTHNPWG